MTVSATEWAASESIALEPLISPATALATAMPRLAAAATITVKADSPPSVSPSSVSLLAFASLMVGSMSEPRLRRPFILAGRGRRLPG
ncbi:hypothetical protein SCALM49S_09543 [Streptomyces californicus]